MKEKQIAIANYTYDLPSDRIALVPLAERQQSQLLVYEKGKITHHSFDKISEQLSPESIVVFNNSRVINARLVFTKSTGGTIEIFLLQPTKTGEYKPGKTCWHCFVGGISKWKQGTLVLEKNIAGQEAILRATLIQKNENDYTVSFEWEPADLLFEELLTHLGNVPLPPYIKRNADASDVERYQTVYASASGSVAAPTAGLHFTPQVLESISAKGIGTCYLTLHVGAGTFLPVKADTMQAHHMHEETIELHAESLKNLKNAEHIVAVGTTSVRALESAYWLGVKLLLGVNEFSISQWEVYEPQLAETNYPRSQAIEAIIQHMKTIGETVLTLRTSILIVPGYVFKMTNQLLTNFHQPQSTLLLLVAAAIGDDWKKVYDYALENNFRFLSYGDTSLLTIQTN